eukprot:12645354-Alexandrium_andersonii.AAC.1
MGGPGRGAPPAHQQRGATHAPDRVRVGRSTLRLPQPALPEGCFAPRGHGSDPAVPLAERVRALAVTGSSSVQACIPNESTSSGVGHCWH